MERERMIIAIRSQIDLPSPIPMFARWPMSPGIVFSLISSTSFAAVLPRVTSSSRLSTAAGPVFVLISALMYRGSASYCSSRAAWRASSSSEVRTPSPSVSP